jgi:2-succinyl-5-enolpyruvyl-6-hydroxy-3-cyclohexene-1-carboxylate synthase
MPIRYASLLANRKVWCNRGTSGIDGCTSTAIGYSVNSDRVNVLITGDIAFLYDTNALWFNEIPKDFKIVVLNNSGGGIFNMIDGPAKMGSALKYQTTPHQRNIESLATHFGIPYFCATEMTTLSSQLTMFFNRTDACLLEVQTNFDQNRLFFEEFKRLMQ